MGKFWFASRLLIATLLVSSCASRAPLHSTDGTTLVQSGKITAIRDVIISDGGSSGVGQIVGTVLGFFAGSRIGSGNGQTLATAAGAIGGGLIGQSIDANSSRRRLTVLTVQLDNNEMRTIEIGPGNEFQVGEVVKLVTARGVTTVTR